MIYFDNSATTQPCEAAIVKMREAAESIWGNPSSLHQAGLRAHHLVEDARAQILTALGVRGSASGTLFFCGSGTEADNLAVFGTAYAKKSGRVKRIVTTDSEHPAILEPCKQLEARGDFEIVRLSTRGGKLDLAELEEAITPDTILLSVMTVNNETGACYDVKSAFSIAKQKQPQIVTHTDAVQAFRKIPFSATSLGADLVTISGHKIHGPKGIGALYVANAVLKAKKLVPLIYGGGQENGMRSGTENTIGIAGFGAAAAQPVSMEQAAQVRAYLLAHLPQGVQANLPAVAAPHILNLTIPGLKSETLLNDLSQNGICISAGSACASHGKHVSHVLLAFGLSAKEADCSVRVSLQETSTIAEADAFLAALQTSLATRARIR